MARVNAKEVKGYFLDSIYEWETDFLDKMEDKFGIYGCGCTDVPEEMCKDVAAAQEKLLDAYVKILRYQYKNRDKSYDNY